MRRLDKQHGGDRTASDKLMIDAFRKMGEALEGDGAADPVQPVSVRGGEAVDLGAFRGGGDVADDGRH